MSHLVKTESTSLLPLPFEHSLHVVLMASASELQESIHLYQELIRLNGRGTIHSVDGQPSVKNVQNLFLKMAEKCHAPFKVTLSCGNLNSLVQMFPPPNFDTFDQQSKLQSFWDDFKICGFLNTVDVSSPPTISRHLVLPVSVSGKLHSVCYHFLIKFFNKNFSSFPKFLKFCQILKCGKNSHCKNGSHAPGIQDGNMYVWVCLKICDALVWVVFQYLVNY